ncbi:hypothetical protein KC343_g10700 [Hortaea werneckii]|nr:hypothetical protein KC352_g23400 [Hortaea werneckii]KAI7558647.1 hypothetical protein KC317_g10874 [Hortaea werneckii]KAI7606296.1 hypothetical protein KC346_g10608 [Hortaea werneckii]KAI7613895.1 hypothetical protein KC343_g10700 [Hortaea werneckii]KAI7651524.1 hypothetical protein KC319_g10860 [Hortaea werneckii]
MLRQDPNCVEYIYRITELAYNVQISHIRADPYAAPTVKAIEVLQDFHELFSDKLEHMLPQAHGRIKSTLVNGMHLELLLTGAENLVESLEKLLEICPGDEHLLHDLNVAKKLQARAHDEENNQTSAEESEISWTFASTLTVLSRKPFACASDHYVVPQSFEMEGWEPGNGPYQLSPTEQQAVHDLQDKRGWPKSSFE